MTEYPVWAESTKGDNQPDQRRLNQARADLALLPDLTDELRRCLTERVPVDGSSSRGKPGSRPPLRLEVLHLVDDRRKPGWWTDPREIDYTDRFGVAVVLDSWSRVIAAEMVDAPEQADHATVRSETSYLVECWDWICEQQWAEELADDITSISANVRAALGIRKEPRYVCPDCNNRAFVAVGGFLVCTEGHEQPIRDLEMQYRRRPAARTSEIAEQFQIQPERIRKWAERKQIKPVRSEGKAAMYLPWDVFCLLNPGVQEALDERDRRVAQAEEAG